MTPGAVPYDLRETLALLRRELRLILSCIGVALAVALGAVLLAAPRYTATALLLADPSPVDLLSDQGRNAIPTASESARIESEVEILRSDRVALAVIDAADLSRDPAFATRPPWHARLAARFGRDVPPAPEGDALRLATLHNLKPALAVRRRGLTYVITVAVRADDPQRAARLANLFAETHIALQVEAKVAASAAARDLIAGQIAQARQALARSEAAFDTYLADNLDRLEREGGNGAVAVLRARMREIGSASTEAELIASRADAARLRGDWQDMAQLLGEAPLVRLAAQRGDLARRATALSGEAEIDRIDAALARRGGAALDGLRSEIEALHGRAAEYRTELRRELLAGDLAPSSVAEIYELQQETEIARRQHVTLLNRMRDLATRAAVQIADTRIVSQALPPRIASWPNRRMVLFLALLGGAAFGIGWAFVREYHLGGVTSLRQLGNVLAARVGAALPRLPGADLRASAADAVIDTPLSTYAESVRRVRAILDQALDRQGGRASSGNAGSADDGDPGGASRAVRQGRVVMVTSAIPGEGKTSLALALARTYAQAGSRVLLIDADLRKPDLHHTLGFAPSEGFLDYLRDPDSVQDQDGFYADDPRSGAGVIVGRGRSDLPTDQILQSATFDALLERAREQMDITILDTSPLLSVVDARYVAQRVDAALFCVRFASTGQADLRQGFGQLTDSLRPGAPVISVLNRDETRGTAYRQRGYIDDPITA
ncbi:MAG: GNVR domain-containing protein [Celeribacter sp.]|jgi:uncharacterized protein involved in exopolysaccharide biosynthesis/Mrp family chromosome partitioning ATPase